MLREISRGIVRLPRSGWLAFSLVLALIFIVFIWHLGSLTPGLSQAEIDYSKSSSSWSQIVNNPVNAPHRVVQLIFFKLFPGHPSALRLASIVFAMAICLAFCRLAVSWFGRAIGLFASLIFACLPLLAISARQANPAVLFFLPAVFISLYAWLTRAKQRLFFAYISLMVAAAIAIFTPGMIIWLVAGAIICRKQLTSVVAQLPAWQVSVGLVPLAAGLASLALSAVKQLDVLKSLMLIPDHFSGWLTVVKHIGWMFASLFVRTGHNDQLIVGRLPVLNILLIALFVFGVYAMQAAARPKSIWLGLSVIYAIVLAGINDSIGILALGVPALIIFIAAGLRYLYIEWRSIFPRNPVPKTFALALIALVAAVQVYFGLRYSLAAWPQSPPTQSAYVLK